MKNTLSTIAYAILIAAILDLAILFTGLAQIAFEGRTGYWSPFWKWQAEQMVQLLLR